MFSKIFNLDRNLSPDPQKTNEVKTYSRVCNDLLWNSRTVAGTILGGAHALDDVVPTLLRPEVDRYERINIANRWYQVVTADCAEVRPHFSAIGKFENDMRAYATRLRKAEAVLQVPVNRTSIPGPAQDAVVWQSPTEERPRQQETKTVWRRAISLFGGVTFKPRATSTPQPRKPFRRFTDTFGKLIASVSTLVAVPSQSGGSSASRRPSNRSVHRAASAPAAGGRHSQVTEVPILAPIVPRNGQQPGGASKLAYAIANDANHFEHKLEVLLSVYSEFSHYHTRIIDILSDQRLSADNQVASLGSLLQNPRLKAMIKPLERYSRSAPSIGI